MKKNTVIGIILIVSGLIAISIGTMIDIPKEKLNNTNNENNKKVDKEELTNEEKNNINSLMIYGVEIYDSGAYKELKKSSTGYYITLGELKQKGYKDVSSLVLNCEDDDAIIFFDEDNKEKYEGYPIFTVHDCSKFHKSK